MTISTAIPHTKRSLVCVYTHVRTHAWQTTPNRMLVPFHHTFPPILKVKNLHLVGGWMCISSNQKFWKRETATAFQPSINARLHPPLLDRNWVVVAFAGGAWEVKSTASEWGCWARHTHTPTQQLLLLFLSIAPPSEGERLFQRWTDSAAQGFKDNFTNYFLN